MLWPVFPLIRWDPQMHLFLLFSGSRWLHTDDTASAVRAQTQSHLVNHFWKPICLKLPSIDLICFLIACFLVLFFYCFRLVLFALCFIQFCKALCNCSLKDAVWIKKFILSLFIVLPQFLSLSLPSVPPLSTTFFVFYGGTVSKMALVFPLLPGEGNR